MAAAYLDSNRVHAPLIFIKVSTTVHLPLEFTLQSKTKFTSTTVLILKIYFCVV
jgi:hypothetical protein